MEEISIQGNPRAFAASYAKDIVVGFKAIYDSSGGNQYKEICKSFDFFADHIHEWMIQDYKKPITDNQYSYIEDIITYVRRYSDREREYTLNKAKTMNVEQAKNLIEHLLGDDLPPEYKNGTTYRQGDIAKATKNRSQRDE